MLQFSSVLELLALVGSTASGLAPLKASRGGGHWDPRVFSTATEHSVGQTWCQLVSLLSLHRHFPSTPLSPSWEGFHT